MLVKPRRRPRLAPAVLAALVACGAATAARAAPEAAPPSDSATAARAGSEAAPATTVAPSFQDASERSQRLADELRSPFCPGKTLLTCTSGQAFTARQEIRDRLLAGEPEPAIIADFQTRYGMDIKNPPQPWYAAVGPFVPALAGVLVLLAITWRWRRGAHGEPTPVSADSNAAGPDAERLARLRRQVIADDD